MSLRCIAWPGLFIFDDLPLDSKLGFSYLILFATSFLVSIQNFLACLFRLWWFLFLCIVAEAFVLRWCCANLVPCATGGQGPRRWAWADYRVRGQDQHGQRHAGPLSGGEVMWCDLYHTLCVCSVFSRHGVSCHFVCHAASSRLVSSRVMSHALFSRSYPVDQTCRAVNQTRPSVESYNGMFVVPVRR